MTKFEIRTEASTRSKARRTMSHVIEAETADDAIYEARMAHIAKVGWNASVWVSVAK